MAKIDLKKELNKRFKKDIYKYDSIWCFGCSADTTIGCKGIGYCIKQLDQK